MRQIPLWGQKAKKKIGDTYDPSDANKWEKAELCVVPLRGTRNVFVINQMMFKFLSRVLHEEPKLVH